MKISDIDAVLLTLNKAKEEKGIAGFPVHLDDCDLPLVDSGCSYTEQLVEKVQILASCRPALCCCHVCI